MKDQVVRYLDRSQLPNEVEPLKDMVVTLSQALLKLWEELETLKAENAALKAQNETLIEEVKLLRQKIFGRKSRSKKKDSKSGDPSSSANQNRKKQKPTGRKPFNKDLPREDEFYYLTDSEDFCPHCQVQYKLIGEETSEQVEYVRASLKVIIHHRGKYACPKCSRIEVAAAPYKPIEKGSAGPQLIAHVIVSKICDHLPLYRQEKILRRHGAAFNRSTLCSWMQEMARLLKPLYEEMKTELVATDHLYADDTPMLTLGVPVAVVEEDAEATTQKKSQQQEVTPDTSASDKEAKKGYIWVYGREGSHHRKPLVVYDFSVGRSGKNAQEFLENFEGFLQRDAYSGYRRTEKTLDGKAKKNPVITVGCWAHVLRKFEEAMVSNPTSPATEVLSWIGKLYAVEREAKAKDLDTEAVKTLRETQSRPILKEIRKWLDEIGPKTLPKSLLGKAITYARNNWEELIVYVTDGRLGIDNNFSERNIKLAVMGRKNYLFAGSEGGGETLAIFYSFIQTCLLNGLNPEEYLADVMIRIQYHPASKVKELLPHYWKPPNQQAQAQAA